MREDRPLPLPSVDPGQIWLIEHDPSAALGALDRAVLTHANVVLYDPVYVGLAVCAHDADALQTAIFGKVELKAVARRGK